MTHTIRRTTLVVGVLALSVAVLPSAASAATKKFSITQASGTLTGTTGKGVISKSTWGKGTSRLTVLPPKLTNGQWKFKGCTIKWNGTVTSTVGAIVKGPVKLTGGTGKCKGLKGKGTYTGDQFKGSFQFKGTYSIKK